MPKLAVSTRISNLRTRTKLLAAMAVLLVTAAVALICYALFIKAQAESLLNDIAALKIGSSTESDVEQVARKHIQYVVSGESNNDGATTTFKVQNLWLAMLRLEPQAFFGASVSVRNGRVHHIGAWLLRSMDSYPTFQASAGMVDEYDEYPQYLTHNGHFEFPTPIGKPYLKVLLDSHASSVQRQHAFGFSFSCLIKSGGGCDLPCDYLPLAWQDWKIYLQAHDSWDIFNQHYPNRSRCKESSSGPGRP
jgi:hypothetical protein